MFKRKNDYSVIVFFENSPKPKKWKYVHKVDGFAQFLNKKHPSWIYFNLYNRRSGGFMQRIHKGNHVSPFPKE